jgi:hypothetical protein
MGPDRLVRRPPPHGWFTDARVSSTVRRSSWSARSEPAYPADADDAGGAATQARIEAVP